MATTLEFKEKEQQTQLESQQDTRSVAESQLAKPPDGGLHAWLKVLGGFLIYINIWSVTPFSFKHPS
jgi:hypothetical protein